MSELNDINRNFEFLYYGKGRSLGPDYHKIEEPIRTLFNLGGIEEFSYESEHMNDHVCENYHRSFSYLFMLIGFPDHKIKAFVTCEERPQHPNSPNYITRIRLGNYCHDDPLTQVISEALFNLPKSD